MDNQELIKFGLSTLAPLVSVLAYLVLVVLALCHDTSIYLARRPTGNNLTMDELKPQLWFCMKRCVMMTLVGGGYCHRHSWWGLFHSGVHRIILSQQVLAWEVDLLYALLVVIMLPMMLAACLSAGGSNLVCSRPI